jgi:hypothetical protein
MDDISDREHYSKGKTMKKIDATVWTSDKHDANMVGDRTWLTIRIGDHEILVNVQDGVYCIGCIHKDGTRAVYRKGQKDYIKRIWENYA